MAIEWVKDLEIGVDAIDHQHQELFRRINLLLEACNQGKGRDAINDTIDFLEEYVIRHFRDEEELMQKSNYPGYNNHKPLHAAFIQQFSNVKEQIAKEGVNVPVVLATNRIVVNWLNHHIRNVDVQIGEYINRTTQKNDFAKNNFLR